MEMFFVGNEALLIKQYIRANDGEICELKASLSTFSFQENRGKSLVATGEAVLLTSQMIKAQLFCWGACGIRMGNPIPHQVLGPLEDELTSPSNNDRMWLLFDSECCLEAIAYMGAACMTLDDKHYVELSQVLVNPTRQRGGIGAPFVEMLITKHEIAKDVFPKPISGFVLAALPAALPFWKRLGFSETKQSEDIQQFYQKMGTVGMMRSFKQ